LNKFLSNRKNTDTENAVSEKNRHGNFPRHTNTNLKQKGITNKKDFNKREKSEISLNLNPRKK
jgi:hypothetical protein